jgi:carbon-monoxide dehydrogenase large subunit
MKGAGESGLGSTLGALCSAIEDAFPELDLRVTQLPLTPSRVWKAIHSAPRRDGSGVGPRAAAEVAAAAEAAGAVR